MMNITLRIPTQDQYAFAEVSFESDEMTPELLRRAYEEYMNVFRFQDGLAQKEWNDCLDRYRKENKMDADLHEKMNRAQQWMIHEMDKSNTRLATRQSKLPPALQN